MKSPFAQLAHYPATSLKIMLGKSAFLHHEIRIHIGGIVVHVGDDRRCQPVGHHRTTLPAAFHGSLARVVVGVEMQFSIIINASQPIFLVPNHSAEALGFLVVERVAVAVILVSSGFRFAHLHDFTRGVWVGRVVVAVVQRIALLNPTREVVEFFLCDGVKIIITHFQLIAGAGRLSRVVSFGVGQPIEIIILIFIAGCPAQCIADNWKLVIHLEDVPYQIIRITVVLDKEISPASLFLFGRAPRQSCFRFIGSGCTLLLLAVSHAKTPQLRLWGIRCHPSRNLLCVPVFMLSMNFFLFFLY